MRARRANLTTRPAQLDAGEYDAIVLAAAGLPRLGMNGTEASVGYRVSPSILVSGGWQHQGYTRGTGIFFNGAPQLKLDALFMHLSLNTSEQ